MQCATCAHRGFGGRVGRHVLMRMRRGINMGLPPSSASLVFVHGSNCGCTGRRATIRGAGVIQEARLQHALQHVHGNNEPSPQEDEDHAKHHRQSGFRHGLVVESPWSRPVDHAFSERWSDAALCMIVPCPADHEKKVRCQLECSRTQTRSSCQHCNSVLSQRSPVSRTKDRTTVGCVSVLCRSG